MKKLVCILLAACLVMALCACGAAPSAAAPTVAPTAGTEPAEETAKVYKIGICQLVQHAALDAATLGFRERLTELLGAENVEFIEQNAQGDSQVCATICNQFVADGVDLILANATPALLAATSATDTIPVLGTAVTEYGNALGIENFSGTTGTNISGTSDLAPLDQQAAMITDLFPDTKSVGILYCSAEPNSVYQAKVVSEELEKSGIEVSEFTFSDSNDVAAVTASACESSDVIYIPTDNAAAANAELIRNIAVPAGVPIIAGEEGICAGCGVATLSISYYDIGAAAAEMAADILLNGADVSTMPIGYAAEFTKKFNSDICTELKVEIPADFVAIG